MKRGLWHFLTTLIVFSVLTTTTFAQTAKTSYDIFVPEGNTILSYLPISALKTINTLKVSGILYEDDIAVIQKCENLRHLDLSLAYITESPEKQGKDLAEQQLLKEYVQQVLSLRESVGEELYNRGEINASQYARNKIGVDAANAELSKMNITKSDKSCYLPAGAFANMTNLETVILPLEANGIQSGCFVGCIRLKKVVLPPYLSFIGADAFAKCIQLTSIDFPNSLTSINYRAFNGSGLINVDLSKCHWGKKELGAFYTDYSQIVDWGNGRRTEVPAVKKVYKLPQGVEIVRYRNTEGDTIYFPSSLTTLKNSQFKCTVLFASPNPPYVDGSIEDCIVYCPKGSKTKYFVEFGDDNVYIEVDDIYAVSPGETILEQPQEELKESLSIITDDGLEVELEDMPIIGLEDLDKEEKCFEYGSEELSLKPSFLGGDINSFYKWFNSRLEYPEIAREDGIQGRVDYSFIVNTDGHISDIKIIRSAEDILNKAVMRVLSSSPNWEPGMVNNKAVQVECTGSAYFLLR